jgi:ribosomal protein S14
MQEQMSLLAYSRGVGDVRVPKEPTRLEVHCQSCGRLASLPSADLGHPRQERGP